jgi:Fe2+ or Zn2+ uptake regulation protein
LSNLLPEITRALRTAGIRPTAQRYAVLGYLAQSEVHATAEEILVAVNRRDPRASRATVYNTLHALAKAGLVHEVASDGGAARFDANLRPHHHFICEGCGAVEDIPWFDLPQAAGRAVLGKRSVREYQIVFRGACLRCRESQSRRGVRQ